MIHTIRTVLQSKIQVISNVLSMRRYAAIAIISGICLGLLYYTLTMSMLPIHIGVQEVQGYMAISITLTVGISVLAGINFAMIAFKINMVKRINSVKTDSSAILGGAFAAFTPGCPACTAPLAVVLGAVGGLSLFPMQGLELKFISVGVLGLSIWWIARGLQTRSCCKIG